MKLYHYSKLQHRELLTRREQAVRGTFHLTPEEERDAEESSRFRCAPGSYLDSISFLLDPAPLDVIGGAYPVDHPAWAPGGVIYEHVVDSKSLGDCPFVVVETPIANWMADNLWVDNDTAKMMYFKARKLAEIMIGARGESQKELSAAISAYSGRTRAAYESMIGSPDFKDRYSKMYAPSVPHLMVYPKSGAVRVSSSKKVVVPTKK
jgi:hypothetical protein